jgi:hypothetical protein
LWAHGTAYFNGTPFSRNNFLFRQEKQIGTVTLPRFILVISVAGT